MISKPPILRVVDGTRYLYYLQGSREISGSRFTMDGIIR